MEVRHFAVLGSAEKLYRSGCYNDTEHSRMLFNHTVHNGIFFPSRSDRRVENRPYPQRY